MAGVRHAGFAPEILSRGGRVGEDLHAVDWSQTTVGPPETWSQSLTTAVSIVLGSRFSMWMAWGEELTFFCNDAYRRDTLGDKYPWALGKPASEVWSEIWDEIGPRIESVLETGEATWDENLMLFLERSGYKEETYHTFSYSPLTDDHGDTVGMLCVVSEDTKREVSERQLATLRELATETASAETEEEFLAATGKSLESNPRSLPFTMVYRFDEEGGAELVAHSGIEPGQPAAPPRIDELSYPWPLDRVQREEWMTLEDLDERFSELPSGAWEDAPTRARLVRLDDRTTGRPYGVFIAATNPYNLMNTGLVRLTNLIAQHISTGITSARAFEHERERAEELAELDRAKTAFFTNVSHELRTPLTLMLGPSEDALTDLAEPLPRSQRRRLEVIDRNARRLLKLVNSLLDFARAEAATAVAHFEPTDLANLTREIASMFESAAERSGLSFEFECHEAIKDAWVDHEMWTKIVSNLVSNAIKYTLEGGVTVRLVRRDGSARLSVIDTGSGIAEEEQAGLFERFHRLGTSESRSNEGSGIGLALVAELAARHDAEVSVSSAPGQGSEFHVDLPLGNAHLPQDQLVGADTSEATARRIARDYAGEVASWIADDEGAAFASADESKRSDYTVLVVDDNADMRRYVGDLLAGRFDVETAPDGVAALEKVHDDPPDLVVTDVMMPRLDGFGLLRALREDPDTMHIPVIMLSARAGEEGVVVGLEAGADDYLTKPFTARELLARVSAGLELDRVRRSRSELERRQLLLDEAQRIAHMGSWEVDWQTGAVTITEEVARIIGVSREEVAELGLQPAIERVLHEDDRALVRDALAACLEGEPIDCEARVVSSDSERVIRVVGELIAAEDAEPTKLRGSIQDVTEQRRIERELAAASAERDIADQLQRSLLPEVRLDSDALEVASHYHAGVAGTEVGGDWYDVIELGDDRTALVIGDVMGRGVKAATAMGQLRTAARAYARMNLEPADLIGQLERVVEDLTDDQLVTLIYGVHDARDGVFTYANAGHLPPIVRRADGSVVRLAAASGPPLCAGFAVVDHVQQSIPLERGDILLLYTDGLIERRDINLESRLAALESAVADAPSDPHDLLASVVSALASDSPEDDVAVLAAKVPVVDRDKSIERVAEMDVAFDPRSIRDARQFTQETLTEWGARQAVLRDATLLVSELVTNAVLHGAPPLRLTLAQRAHGLTISVRDMSDRSPEVRDFEAAAEGGRGLRLVSVLARRWGTRPDPPGKTVWFTLPL